MEEFHEHIVEQIVDVPVPQITVPVPFQEEIVEVIRAHLTPYCCTNR